MTIKAYVLHMQKDFFTACGYLTGAATVFLTLNPPAILTMTLLWQILLTALTFTFYKFAFVNQYELDDRAQMFSYFICSLLADISIAVLLNYFTPGGEHNLSGFMTLILAFIVIKAMVYPLMYLNAKEQAREFNKKLILYKRDGGH